MAGPGCDTDKILKGFGVRLLNQLVQDNFEGTVNPALGAQTGGGCA